MKKYKYHIIAVVLFGIGVLVYGAQSGQNNDSIPQIGTSEGDIAPAFLVTTIDNTTVSSDDTKGKVLVITSSAAWCQTCVMEAQQFAPVYEKYKDQNVVFLTIDIDPRDTKEAIEAFRTHTNTPWFYTDASGAAKLIEDYRFNRFEITYVIDEAGVIQHKDGGITDSNTLDQVLVQVLGV